LLQRSYDLPLATAGMTARENLAALGVADRQAWLSVIMGRAPT